MWTIRENLNGRKGSKTLIRLWIFFPMCVNVLVSGMILSVPSSGLSLVRSWIQRLNDTTDLKLPRLSDGRIAGTVFAVKSTVGFNAEFLTQSPMGDTTCDLKQKVEGTPLARLRLNTVGT